ncbi:glucokinase [Rhodospirillum rubrum]|uniref:glucokinase n=1 Tax=Rhodospirillum rubrum TaxID=1085 RepID=UPI001904D194|nr:glucokinase [Rhodospirillum rubrum]MBK1665861.1 glucokinase [Rhodospirillum rubrum]MBK1677964.1 glucokinase [Rhodospirillum rubrum]
MAETFFPGLIADIGGTNARFALTTPEGGWRDERVYRCAAFPGPAEAAAHYLAEVLTAFEPRPDRGAICVACPVNGDHLALTNHGAWSFSIGAVAARLGLAPFHAVNDFIANALAIPRLGPSALIEIGGGGGLAGAPIAAIGPGTGLGVAILIPGRGGNRTSPLATEGGHVTLPAVTDREAVIISALRAIHGHASAERAISGPGLVWLSEAIRAADGLEPVFETPPSVMEKGLARSCPVCAEAVDTFYALLGTVVGDLVLSTGAQGGVYLMGGILPRHPEALRASAFLARFREKGRFRDYLDVVPIRLVTHPYPAFIGLAGLVSD